MVWCPVLIFSSMALMLKIFPSGVSVQCHELNLQISLPAERYVSSLVCRDLGVYLGLQTDRPLLLFALYFITGTEISENLQGILRIYS